MTGCSGGVKIADDVDDDDNDVNDDELKVLADLLALALEKGIARKFDIFKNNFLFVF